MPCNNDHMKPTEREKESKEAAELIVWLAEAIGEEPFPEDLEASDHVYGESKSPGYDPIARLCGILNRISDEKMKEICFKNLSDPIIPRLLSWWQRHQEEDKRRNIIHETRIFISSFAAFFIKNKEYLNAYPDFGDRFGKIYEDLKKVLDPDYSHGVRDIYDDSQN